MKGEFSSIVLWYLIEAFPITAIVTFPITFYLPENFIHRTVILFKRNHFMKLKENDRSSSSVFQVTNKKYDSSKTSVLDADVRPNLDSGYLSLSFQHASGQNVNNKSYQVKKDFTQTVFSSKANCRCTCFFIFIIT